MKKFFAPLAAMALSVMAFASPASAAEAVVDLSSTSISYDVNGTGVLSIWGVSAVGSNALVANPDYNYPTELSIASWIAILLKAQELGKSVKVGESRLRSDDLRNLVRQQAVYAVTPATRRASRHLMGRLFL